MLFLIIDSTVWHLRSGFLFFPIFYQATLSFVGFSSNPSCHNSLEASVLAAISSVASGHGRCLSFFLAVIVCNFMCRE